MPTMQVWLAGFGALTAIGAAAFYVARLLVALHLGTL